MHNTTNEYWVNQDLASYLPTYKRIPLAISHAKGSWVWDVEGNKYLDLLAGIAVNNLGHCHPVITKAICKQAGELMHISNFFISKPQVNLAKLLTELSGLSRVFFTNSGAESVEGAIKIARKYAHHHGRSGEIVFMENAFHGRTLGTIAAGKKNYQKGFSPIPTGFKEIPFNDIDSAKKHINSQTAAVILEPIQGEGGIHPADKNYLAELRAHCDSTDTLLIFDEIQCGIGRTGHLFAKDHFGVEPDILTLAKGLGSGMPVGAFLCSEKIAEVIEFGDHGTTFGGNPLACAAALATVNFIRDQKIEENTNIKAEWFRKKLDEVRDNFSVIKEVRGVGLMIGLVLTEESKPYVQKFLDRGIIINATAGNVIRLVPPLTITQEDLSTFLSALTEILKSESKGD
nr:aspartate aminotransferase family protein [Saprospiraceae bacterium]